MIDQEVRSLVDNAYQRTKQLLTDKKEQVEILAKELLEKEVLFKSDVEKLIGKRPFEEKKSADVIPHDENAIKDIPANSTDTVPDNTIVEGID